MGMGATAAPSDTVAGETSRMEKFMQDAVVTNLVGALIAAPVKAGYAIGYIDRSEVRRAFIIPKHIAVEFGQAMIQEIEADQKRTTRTKLAARLRSLAQGLDDGGDVEAVYDHLSELSEEGIEG